MIFIYLQDKSKQQKNTYYTDGNRESTSRQKTREQRYYLYPTDNSDLEYDNGNISPLYSNWDTVIN